MTARDMFELAYEALRAHQLRYGLSALAIAVGIAAVVLMSSIGEGARRYVESQVSMFGTTLIGVHAGHVSTRGIPGAPSGTARKLTIEDAMALARLPGVSAAVPVVSGSARVEYQGRARSVMVWGVTAEMPRVWQMKVASGTFLPDGPWNRGGSVVVLGPRVATELFGRASPLGEMVRLGTSRFRVVGVMQSKGVYLGFDLDDVVHIPTARAMSLFDLSELGEVNLMARSLADIDSVSEHARRLMIERHRGEEDVTIVSQKDALVMIGRILGILSGVVTAIAAISLLVGAISIFTILWIVVNERTAEVGLVKALGAHPSQILLWYLCEAAMVSAVGGAAGIAVGMGGAALIGLAVPRLEATTSPAVAVTALAVAVGVGLLAGVAPAVRASRLDPVEALHAE
jgi:putative ABC transport system permease protein